MIARLGGRRQIKYEPVVTVPPVAGWTSFQEGTDSYTGASDTYIQQGANEGSNFSTAATVIVDANASDERFGLWRWDDLDAAFDDNTVVTVTSASIDFNVTSEGQGMILNDLLTDYTFSTITWTNSTPVSGTDISLSAVGIWPGDNGYTGPINIILDNATVQRWITNPSTNYGLWGYAAGTDPLDGQQVESDNAATVANRPKLNIAYTEPG